MKDTAYLDLSKCPTTKMFHQNVTSPQSKKDRPTLCFSEHAVWFFKCLICPKSVLWNCTITSSSTSALERADMKLCRVTGWVHLHWYTLKPTQELIHNGESVSVMRLNVNQHDAKMMQDNSWQNCGHHNWFPVSFKPGFHSNSYPTLGTFYWVLIICWT